MELGTRAGNSEAAIAADGLESEAPRLLPLPPHPWQKKPERMLLRMIRSLRSRLFLFAAFSLAMVSTATRGQQLSVAPPLHTRGHQIVDAAGHTVRLTSVNWYGFDQKEFVVGGLDHAPLATIVSEIVALGVNSVRLPWANETLEHNPVVAGLCGQGESAIQGQAGDGDYGRGCRCAREGAHHGHPGQPYEPRGLVLRREGWQRTLV